MSELPPSPAFTSRAHGAVLQPATVRRLPLPLKRFLQLSALLTALSLLRTLVHFLLHRSWLAFDPLYPPRPGIDFYLYTERMRFLHQPAFFTRPFPYDWYYPAPGALLYAFFYQFNVHGHWLAGYSVMAAIVAIWLWRSGRSVARALMAHGIASGSAAGFVLLSLLLSFPIYISLQRGNFESLIWIMLALAIWQMARHHWSIAAVLLGVAASFKLYPVLYFGLFLKQRRWKEAATGLGVMALTTLASYRFLEPDIRFAARSVSEGVSRFPVAYAMGIGPIYDHSLFLLVKIALVRVSADRLHMLHAYLLFAGFAATLLFFARILRLPATNQLLFLVALSVLLPPASFDYSLQSLYIPWAILVLTIARHRFTPQRWHLHAMLLFATLMAPITFILHKGTSFGGAVKGVALLALLALSAWQPMEGFLDKPPAGPLDQPSPVPA